MTREFVILIIRVVKRIISFHMDIQCEINISHVRFVYART